MAHNPANASSILQHVCLPVNLDVFILNEPVCEGRDKATNATNQEPGATYIAPITQPNYVSLRLDNSQIQHDILPRVNLQNARPASVNPRTSKARSTPFKPVSSSDSGRVSTTGDEIDRSRLGAYIHWTIPRGYRSGTLEAAKPEESNTATNHKEGQTNSNPTFPLVPNRWLLVRSLRKYENPSNLAVKPVTAWIIESDRLREINDLGDDVDLQTDVTPFVAYSGDSDNQEDLLDKQAEKYIGLKQDLPGWKESVSDRDRIQLTLMNSSNPLFADYTPHNPNVFSIKDNFFLGREGDRPKYLTSATCDYFVCGWHHKESDDPLCAEKNKTAQKSLSDRLAKLFCKGPEPKTTGDASLKANLESLESIAGTRLVCHAARYGVTFDLEHRPKTPGDDFAKLLSKDITMEPVAVGTTPLDALLAFYQAHENDAGFLDSLSQSEPSTDGPDPKSGSQIAAALMFLREQLYATEDDYDSRIKASDLVFTHNHRRYPGGFQWHYDRKKTKDEQPVKPSDIPIIDSSNPNAEPKSEVDMLHDLNEQQRLYDSNDRKLKQLQWALFSEFFKYVSDPSNNSVVSDDSPARTSVDRVEIYKSRVGPLRVEIQNLLQDQLSLEQIMRARRVEAKKLSDDPFYKRNDPTLCLAGIDGGWDANFLDNTPTRFFGLDQSSDASLIGDFNDVFKGLEEANLPSELVSTIKGLILESSKGYRESLKSFGHRFWSKQPFSPQFVEWEGIYYHIPRSQWSVDQAKSALASSNHPQVKYVNHKSIAGLPQILNDQRHVAGRMLVLPQPSFALGAVLSQVLDSIPIKEDAPNEKGPDGEDLPFNLNKSKDRKELLDAVKKLKFISGELSGLSDALLTLANGQHVKPNLRTQGGNPVPLEAAVKAGRNLDMHNSDFELIGGETAKTPYGTLTNFPARARPFKPVQHGQLALTRLTIVDKFGQAVTYPPPKQTLRDNPQGRLQIPEFIHPCIDEQLIPNLLPDGKTLNTVFTPQDTRDKSSSSGYPMTPFIQLTPAINQEARINATFLRKVTENGKARWASCDDWDNPIFGWVIVNYADSSLQFFTGEGIFFTSMQFGGPTGTIATSEWQPFTPPDHATTLVSDQLLQLIKKMKGVDGARYLLEFWDMIRRAIPTMPFPPSDYAQYANAIVGKSLALVNAGWSLELAQPAFWQQNTLPAPRPLRSDETRDYLRGEAEKVLSGYSFPVKLGDADRPFDGLVAYWDSDTSTTETDFQDMYTYFPNPDDGDKGFRVEITPAEYPELVPYFAHTDDSSHSTGKGIIQKHLDQMLVTTVLMDPYTPIHLYSSILPIKKLELPAWSLSGAMKNMTAFFTVGPILITKDVPKIYDVQSPLHPDSWLTSQKESQASSAQPVVKLPIAGGKGMWNWLQPYYTDLEDNPPAASSTTSTAIADSGASPAVMGDKKTKYNSLSVGQEDGRMRHDPGPYTFIEGYLQLARPLVVAKPEVLIPPTPPTTP